MTNETLAVTPYHKLYCALSGRQVPLTMSRIFEWESWAVRGRFTIDDLRQVLNYIQAKIRKAERRPESLRLERILDVDRFADDLAEAKSQMRVAAKPKVNPARSAVLEASGRRIEPPDNVKTPAQILDPDWREKLEALKKELE